MKAVCQYGAISLPAWAFGVLASVLVGAPGGLFTMLAWVTALTVPACNLICPGLFILIALHRGRAGTRAGGPSSGATTASAASVSAASSPSVRLLVGPTTTTSSSGSGSDTLDITSAAVDDVSIGSHLTRADGYLASAVLAWGLLALAICLFGAVGKTADPTLRGPQVIGCQGWGIYHSSGMSFKGWY